MEKKGEDEHSEDITPPWCPGMIRNGTVDFVP